MKAFLWVVLIGFLTLCFYFIFASMAPDDSRMIALAFGNSTEDTVEMHVELSMSMARADNLPYLDDAGSMDWSRWANDHYVVVDETGQQATFAKRMKSNLVSEMQTRGYDDGFLVCTLNKGVNYTFTYTPVIGEPDSFVYEFTAPTEDAGRKRVSFQPAP